MRAIKEDLSQWSVKLCTWIGRLKIVKMSVFTKEIYKFSATSIKISVVFFLGTCSNYQEHSLKEV